MKLRRWGVAGLGSAGVVVALAAVAWACVPVATLNVTPGQAKAGSEVRVVGTRYGTAKPVVVRFNALDGPVLGTYAVAAGGVGLIDGTVTIPEGTKPGNYVLIATQEFAPGATLWGVPARALVTVVSATGGVPVLGATPAVPAARPSGLVSSDDGVSAGSLLLAGVGAAGVAMFLAGAAAALAGRRRSTDAPAPVRAES